MPDLLAPGQVRDIEPYYAAFDVFLNTSIFEGLSVATLEAVQAGCPIVTADAGGAGGRRDGRKIGRSRVMENCLSGISHSGLALSVRSVAGAFGVAGGMVTSTTVVAGSLQIEGTEAFVFAPSA